ncbi:MAG: type II secretion system protein [Planctomycetota bacterium]|nr:type II secretion system protein [Planctomycetota bacterium]
MTKCRKGFTNIELTVVIVIILVLMSMVVIGFKVVGDSGKKNATKAALETARAMLNEVDAAGVMSRVKELYVGGTVNYGTPIVAPGKVVVDNDQDPRWGARRRAVWDVAGNTQGSTANVMRQLNSMPMNRQITQKIPAEKLEKVADQQQKDSVMVLRDGWGNPVLFVPAGGMRDVKVSRVLKRVTSMGVVNNDNAPPPSGATGFFVSAGPDGDFSTGDDNMYSFGN